MNKLSSCQTIAIALVAAAAVLISKENNRYTIREAISETSDALNEVAESRIEGNEKSEGGSESK